MTKQKELKQRVRARMAFTQERYTEALARVTGGRPRVDFVELDVPYEELTFPGVVGKVQWWKSLGPATPELRQALVSALEALRGEPAAVLVTRAAFERSALRMADRGSLSDGVRALAAYAEHLRAGARSPSHDGRRLTLVLGGVPVVVASTAQPRARLAVMPVSELLRLAPGLERVALLLNTDASLAGLSAGFQALRRQGLQPELFALLALG